MRQEDRNGMNIAIEVTEGKIVRTIAEIHSILTSPESLLMFLCGSSGLIR